MRNINRRWTVAGGLVCLLAAIACLGVAATRPAERAAAQPAPAAASGVQAYLDENGQLAAPPASKAAASPSAARAFSQFRYEQTPDGGVMLDFNGTWQSATVAHVDADGRVGFECVHAGAGEATEGKE